ncbi:transposable element Tc3 transposase [Trichonephila clavipes]|nr:transposable element Tc3 transposase [Trichonephila clavipes]
MSLMRIRVFESLLSATRMFNSSCSVKEVGTKFHSGNIRERNRYIGSGVVIWRGTMLNEPTKLHVFDRGSLTGVRYRKKVNISHVRLFRGAIEPDFIFMNYNALPHWITDV